MRPVDAITCTTFGSSDDHVNVSLNRLLPPHVDKDTLA
jgi:hypothetical protein